MSSLDPHIDGVIPTPMSPEEKAVLAPAMQKVADPALIKPGMYLGHLSIRELVQLQKELRDEERSR